MNWNKISDAVLKAQTLDSAAREAFFGTLDTDTPEIAADVRRLFQKSQQLDAFMMTAVGDYLPAEAPLYQQGDEVGAWRIDGLIGSGGMGDVYKAHRADKLYDQSVALKVMKGQNARRKNRFDKERQRLAMLNHPNIAVIIDGGVADNRYPYMAMEFIDGTPIAVHCESQKLGRKARLHLFGQICDAITYAHNNLILHRDLKSDNILIDQQGRLKIIDFGIAKLLDGNDQDDLGPYSFVSAAPEQLHGMTLSVQTDIFALGLLLCQLLTGSTATRKADGGVEVSLPDVRADLAAIAKACLETDPQDRYATVSQLSDDIDAYLQDRPVRVYQGSGLYKFSKLIKRAPLASALAASFILALIGGIGVSQYFAQQAQAEAARANQELLNAEWRTNQSTVRMAINSSIAQMMRYAFGQENTDTLSGHLLDYQKLNLGNSKENNPLHAASTSFAIGKHFLDRNDYVNARAILEPWLQEKYGGSDLLISYGQVNLGHTYRGLGEEKLALDMFQKAAQFYEGTPEEYSIDHAATTVEVAILSDDPDVVEASLKVINATLEKEESPFAKIYLLAKLFEIEHNNARWDAAYNTIRRSIEVLEEHATILSQGSDTRRLLLASMELFHRQDIVAARTQIDLAREINETKKGNNAVLARVDSLEATMSWMEGDLNVAIRQFEAALPVFEKYQGQTDNYLMTLARLAMVNADDGQFESAQEHYDAAVAIDKIAVGSWLKLAEIYVIQLRDGTDSAQKLYDQAKAKGLFAKSNIEQHFYFQVMQERGLRL